LALDLWAKKNKLLLWIHIISCFHVSGKHERKILALKIRDIAYSDTQIRTQKGVSKGF